MPPARRQPVPNRPGRSSMVVPRTMPLRPVAGRPDAQAIAALRADVGRVIGFDVDALRQSIDAGLADAAASLQGADALWAAHENAFQLRQARRTGTGVAAAQAILVEARHRFPDCVEAVRHALTGLRAAVDDAGFTAICAANGNHFYEVKGLIDDMRGRIPSFVDDAVARAELAFDNEGHDVIVFIGLDLSPSMIDSFQRKHETNRLLERAATAGRFPAFAMGKSANLRFYEFNLTPAEVVKPPHELRTALGALTPRSKLVIVGHGAPEATAIVSDRGTVRATDLALDTHFRRLAQAIHTGTKGAFADIAAPLNVTLYSCSAAAIDAGRADLQVAADGVVTRPDGSKVGAESTMAGRLLRTLKDAGVYARIKAKTTSVYGPVGGGVVEVTRQVRGPQGAWVTKRVQHDASYQDHRALDFVESDAQATQRRLGKRTVWRDRRNGSTMVTFGASGLDPARWEELRTESASYLSGMTFQAKTNRRHGMKRVFSWHADGTMACVDLADDTKAVDWVFEINKDRAIWYIMGTASHIRNGSERGIASRKFDGVMALCEVVEKATDRASLATRVLEASRSGAVTTHTSTFGGLLGGRTRSEKVLEAVAERLRANANELLPMPRLDDRTLGILA